MNKNKNSRLTGNSQELRRQMTKEESHLWYDFLKKLPVTFHRQKVIGEYIVDFYCAEAGLVIELDGSQHGREENRERDWKRDLVLECKGLRVVRYTNYEINNKFGGVCNDILSNIPSLKDYLKE